MEHRPIWYFSTEDRWWMEPADPVAVMTFLSERIDGIRVTNAYEVLPEPFIATLRDESDSPRD